MAKKNNSAIILLTHLSGLFIGFMGSLVVLLVTGDKEVKEHAKRALNWQISLMIYLLISLILTLVLIGFLFIIALSIMNVVFCIIAAVKSNEGKAWDYPITIHFLK